MSTVWQNFGGSLIWVALAFLLVLGLTSPVLAIDEVTAYSFQRKTWHDGTRYWRAYHDKTDNRIEFEYSVYGITWTEDTSARISIDDADFSLYADSSYAFIAYPTTSVSDTDGLVTTSLVGYWKMNEASWNGTTNEVVDASGNSLHGTRVANATTTTGKFGNGGTFDGTGDYVTIADPGTNSIVDFSSTDSVTFTTWVNPTNLPPAGEYSYDTILSKNSTSDGSASFYFQYRSTGSLEFCYTDTTPAFYCYETYATPMVTGTWQHVAFRYTYNDPGSAAFFYNGIELSGFWDQDPTGVTPTTNNEPVVIGATNGDTENLDGKLDDVRIYDTYLSSQQIGILAGPGYDIEVRQATSYPGTGFSWGSPTVALNGFGTTNYYQYPTITKDSNNKVWVLGNHSQTTTLTDQVATDADNWGIWNNGGNWELYTDREGAWVDVGDAYSGYYAGRYWAGFRFVLDQPIPAGATISNSYIALTGHECWQCDTEDYLRLFVTDATNAPQVTDAAYRPSFDSGSTTVYPTTVGGGVRWPGSGGITWSSSGFNNSSATDSLFQYLVDDNSGLAAESHVVVWATQDAVTGANDDSEFGWVTYAGGAASAPKLTLDYSVKEMVAVQASSANAITTWNTSTTLNASNNSNQYGVIVPRTSGNLQAIWMDGTAIESKNFNGTSWDTSATSVATGVSGMTKTISAAADSTGAVHLLYPNATSQIVYQEYTSSWQPAITIDTNTTNAYPALSIDTSVPDVYAFWIRADDIYYKKGASVATTKALDFDGSNDYVLVPYSASLDPTTDLTIEFWFSPGVTIDSGISANKGLLSKANTNTDANNDWVFFWNSADAGRMRFGTYGDNIQTTTATWTANQWYHIAVTVSSTNTANIYVNGVLDTYNNDSNISTNPINGNQDTALNLGLAKVASGDLYFDGLIDEVKIYNTARTATQIYDSLRTTLVGTESNLIGYWNFNEGTGQVVGDSDSNNNDGTLGATSSSASDDPTWSSTIPYTRSWDASATAWQTAGTNTYVSTNGADSGKVLATWFDGTTQTWGKVLPPVSVSVVLTTSGEIDYGFQSLSGAVDTVSLSQTQTVQNNGNTNEDFEIKTTQATGGTSWTLGSSIGANVFKHEFSTNGGSNWTLFTTADTYQSLIQNVTPTTNQNVDFRLTLPSSTADFLEKTLMITILASES